MKLSNLGALILAIVFIGAIVGTSSLAQSGTDTMNRNPQQAPKRYTVTLSIDDWVRITNGMQYVSEMLKNSDLPAKEVTLIQDSVLDYAASRFAVQINAQVEAEKAKEDAEKKKADSTNRKKN